MKYYDVYEYFSIACLVKLNPLYKINYTRTYSI